jgi:hypothetical protein
MAPKFGPQKAAPRFQKSNYRVGVPIAQRGGTLWWGLAIGTRSPLDARPIDRAEKCPAAAGALGGGPTFAVVGQNSTTMIPRRGDG